MRTMLGMFECGSCCSSLRRSLAAKRCSNPRPLLKSWWLESPICAKLLLASCGGVRDVIRTLISPDEVGVGALGWQGKCKA